MSGQYEAYVPQGTDDLEGNGSTIYMQIEDSNYEKCKSPQFQKSISSELEKCRSPQFEESKLLECDKSRPLDSVKLIPSIAPPNPYETPLSTQPMGHHNNHP